MNNVLSVVPLTRGTRAVILLVVAALLGGTFPLRGQSFAIDWFTVDGGGGTSTGGVFSVSGTVGQPDAGKMSGGNYTLDGGLWGIIAAVQTPGAPLLTITRSGANVIISWLAPAAGFELEMRDGLSAGLSWVTVTSTPVVTNNQKTVTIGITSGSKFYRLRRP
jgi:hypothetical protein